MEIAKPKTNNYSYIVENYSDICYTVRELVSKYYSDNKQIKIMGVTKTVDTSKINYAIKNGLNYLGENRVQEFLSKKDEYKKAEIDFIGHLQTNKVKYIINNVSMIQSVDSIKLAKEINKQSINQNINMDILVEVNIGNELSKSGVLTEEVKPLIQEINSLSNVKVRGLMTIPPKNAKEEIYYKMQSLYENLKSDKLNNINFDYLSMGMSNDYKIAIKYGSNIIRIGTALFGKRN